MPVQDPLQTRALQRCLLSNGSYTVMLGSNGSGFSQWRGMAVTRWRQDPTREHWGSFLLLRDEETNEVWRAVPDPAQQAMQCQPGRAAFNSRQGAIESSLEVAVAADADIELRRLTVRNHDSRPRRLSVTSYAELVLGPVGGDNSHPAFSKMFVQTEWDAEHGLLLATRRRRTDNESQTWFSHGLRVDSAQGELIQAASEVEFETDRALFLGRGRTLRNAQAMQPGARLTNSSGCVLDPVVSLRRSVVLAPGESVNLSWWTQLANSRETVIALAKRMHAPEAATHLYESAIRRANEENARLGIETENALLFSKWASALLSSDPAYRAAPAMLQRGSGGPPTLWAAGISGDRPLLLVQVAAAAALETVDQVLRAQRSWQASQFAVDVVVLNVASDAHGDGLQGLLEEKTKAQADHLATVAASEQRGPKAEIFLLRDSRIDPGLHDGLLTVARVVLGDTASATENETDTRAAAADAPAAIRAGVVAAPPANAGTAALEFPNGTGGFSDSGRAYRITLDGEEQTPAPWVNIIANPDFGCMVSSDGGGYAWSQNSQQNPLTPWPNDPVSDMPYDVLYLRDEDTGALWSATPLPIRVTDTHYQVTHGKGFTRFNHQAHGLELELTQCVPTADTIKLSRLRLVNRSAQTRRLSVTGYVEWAMGANGTLPMPYVSTSRDEATGALFARNRWRPEFAERVAFVDFGGQQHSISGDRGEFLGASGSVTQPAVLASGVALSGRVGAGVDPCGALQTRIELPPGSQIDLLFTLGDAESESAARALVQRYRAIDVDQVLEQVATQWNDLLDTVQVRTPDRAMDIMLNDWLPYQVLAARLWGRTAYYQASGAYGFRDQLQDAMALCVSRPDLVRAQIVRAAGRQFVEGDVQHWWQPPQGQGVRTHITDDRIWLAYVAMHYIKVTGDAAVLDELTNFIAGEALAPGGDDLLFKPETLEEKASIYEHAARGIDISMTRGAHGLPLIGSGDWNDGMNCVGEAGRGESTWLAWLLIDTIQAFAPCADARGDNERAQRWRNHAAQLRAAMEQAWDGDWYRRGYFDNGAPLGSSESDECQIDNIAQSWSVMAGATDPARARQAMLSTDRLLVDREHRVVRLFTPPFDKSRQNPGYIKGYPPGVRENGGQYTHAATWSVFAWAALGDGDRAGELFDLLNPIRHADSADAVQRYKVEPYVVAADVYSTAPHAGRGGWTWYTGSAAWLYRAGAEAVLGFDLRGDRLHLSPCIPAAWPGFEMTYRHRGNGDVVTRYEIKVENPSHACAGIASIELDGNPQAVDAGLPLVEDGLVHRVRIVLG